MVRANHFVNGLAIAILAGCGGSQTSGALQVPTATQGKVHQASTGPLLYVSDFLRNFVYVFTYPKGNHVLTLTGFTNPAGLCSDTNGNVFVLGNRNDNVIEYAHGAKAPTQTLDVPGWTEACSYDANTGNLAVVFDPPSAPPSVAIFASEQGTPTTYAGPSDSVLWYCGYDETSDLFCDGQSGTQRAAFFVLPMSGNTISKLVVSGGQFYQLSQIQWDGQYMAVVDRSFDTVSRIAFTKSKNHGGGGDWKGQVESKLDLNKCGYEEPWESWIYDGSIIVPCTYDSPYKNQDKSHIRVYDYPAGGNPVKEIRRERGPSLLDGVTISVPPAH